MKKKATAKSENYSIIIASDDARKKSSSFSLSRRALIIGLSFLVFIFLVCMGTAIISVCQVSVYSQQIESLKKQVEQQSALRDSNNAVKSSAGYIPEISSLPQVSPDSAFPSAPQTVLAGSEAFEGTVSVPEISAEPVPTLAPTSILSPVPTASFSAEAKINLPQSSAVNVSETVAMKDAVEKISTEFQSNIDARIEQIKKEEKYDNYKIVYDGDLDGDCETVNNWADVISVFIVDTMNNGQKMLSVTPENISILNDIYNKMNTLEIYTEKTDTESGETTDKPKSVTLTIHVTVNSLTYSEAASMFKFNSKQKNKLKELMSPAYYTYFESLLGIDVYDGMPSEQVQKIIDKLPANSKGSDIVRAALIRLGSPYSKGKRGSGNYVDCSYFAWWAYGQAGISIPTSSVEQAKYCFYHKCTVELSDLQPGDLIFWSKNDCTCGRWREIHHVGIYIGDNTIIDASCRKGRVVIRKLWGLHGSQWTVRLYARPYEIQPVS